MKVAGLKHRECVSHICVTHLRLKHRMKLSSSSQHKPTRILLADLDPIPQDSLSPVSPNLQVFRERETSESVIWTLVSFHLTLRDLCRRHAQSIHPIQQRKYPCCPGLRFCDVVRWEHQVIKNGFFFSTIIYFGLFEPKTSVPLPKFCDYNGCLQDFSSVRRSPQVRRR